MINDIKNRIRNSNAVRNGIWLYTMQMFNSVIPLITLPYITRILGSAGYGVFSKIFNLVGYLQVLVEFGFGMSGARKAALTSDRDELSRLLSVYIIVRFMLFLFGCIVSFCIIIFSGYTSVEAECMFALMLMPLGTVFQQNWLFQGRQKMQLIAVINIVSRLLSLVGIFIFVRTPNDVNIYCLLYAFTSVCGGVIGTSVAIIREKLHFTKIDVSIVMQELREGWYVFTTSLSSKVFSSFGVTMLGFVASNDVVGKYAAIQKIPGFLMMMWTPVSQVLYPISSQKFAESYESGREFVNKAKKVIVLFALIAIALLLIAKPAIRILYGDEYDDQWYLIIPLLAWLLCGIYNNFLGIQTLLAAGYSKEYSSCFQISVIVLLVSNIFLARLFGGLGVGISSFVSEFVLGILLKNKIRHIERDDNVRRNDVK